MLEMQDKAEIVAGLLKGMASPHRLLILCQLTEGEKSVSELMETTGIAQTSMSQHLSKLKAEGIVTYRRDHRTLYYSVSNETALQIMKVLYNTYCKDVKNDDTNTSP